ncbi:MAG: cytochrome c [Deltaproteobacteria bacterium]|nr:cytochrome c [Deltaproteobacteria bacterium]
MMRALLITLAMATFVTGCIGGESGEPPVVGIRNMYNQPRYDTQERQPFFADQRSMRPEVAGTVSREMEASIVVATGRNASDDDWIMQVHPQYIAQHGGREAMLSRGKDRYDIYCAPCHAVSGDGKGMVSRRAAALGASGLIAPSFHDDRLRHIPDGQLFATITNGVRNMPAYAHNLPVDDRWAIVEYVRALQLSQAPAAAPENTEQSQ